MIKSLVLRKTIPLVLLIIGVCSVQPAVSQDTEALKKEIEQIRQQLSEMDSLKSRLAELEKKLGEIEEAQTEKSPGLNLSYRGVKARLDGRIFAGIFESGDEGEHPNWSTDISDARLRLTITASDRITIVNRLRTSRAEVDGFDYFYLDYSGVLVPDGLLRLGQRKIDVGQEIWGDNPVEDILISRSVSQVSGYGTGLALRGRINESRQSPAFEVGFINGHRGVMVRPTNGLPFNIKLAFPLRGKWFASASYYDTGNLDSDDRSAISVAEIDTPPSGSVRWSRSLWELDLRYNYGRTGIRPLIPSTDLPRNMFAAAYGVFDDNAVGAADRRGDYWYVQGFHRLSNRLYAAARYSRTGLDNGYLDNLSDSPVPVNVYRRMSFGLGYILTDLTHLKTEYSINDTSGGPSEPSLNRYSVGVASVF